MQRLLLLAVLGLASLSNVRSVPVGSKKDLSQDSQQTTSTQPQRTGSQTNLFQSNSPQLFPSPQLSIQQQQFHQQPPQLDPSQLTFTSNGQFTHPVIQTTTSQQQSLNPQGIQFGTLHQQFMPPSQQQSHHQNPNMGQTFSFGSSTSTQPFSSQMGSNQNLFGFDGQFGSKSPEKVRKTSSNTILLSSSVDSMRNPNHEKKQPNTKPSQQDQLILNQQQQHPPLSQSSSISTQTSFGSTSSNGGNSFQFQQSQEKVRRTSQEHSGNQKGGFVNPGKFIDQVDRQTANKAKQVPWGIGSFFGSLDNIEQRVNTGIVNTASAFNPFGKKSTTSSKDKEKY